VLKLRRIDPMQRKTDARARSYRVISDRSTPNDMENPF
jgi:hypothetical protein